MTELRFCTNHNKTVKSAGGMWLISRNGTRRWLCAACAADRKAANEARKAHAQAV